MKPRLGEANAPGIFQILLAFAFTAGLPSFSQATITVQNVIGASRFELPTTQPAQPNNPNNPNPTPTGPQVVTVYGGTAGNCADPNTDAPCNSCLENGQTGDDRFVGCNERRIYPQTILTFTFLSDTAEGGLPIVTDDQGRGLELAETPTIVGKGQVATVRIRWGQVCAALDEGGSDASNGCDPTVQAKGTIRIGIDRDQNGRLGDSGDDQRDVTAIVHAAIQSVQVICDDAQNNEAVCDFDVNPGDTKVILKDLEAPDNFPISTNIQFRSVRFMWATDEDGGIAAITPATPANRRQDLLVQSGSENEFSLESNRINGLSNDVKYYFKTAAIDQAGNIGHFLSDAAFKDCETNAPPCHTARPGAVVGVLDKDVNCFVATAAWGSPLAAQVETLRRFRDVYLKPTSWGRSFISFYYEHGPKAARFIAVSSARRFAARVALAPAWLFAKISLELGVGSALALVLALAALPAGGWMWIRRCARTCR